MDEGSINLNRKEFFFLYKAIVTQSEKILIAELEQGLNRTNAQHFYGFQDGKATLNSVNHVIQKFLEECGYNLAAFRNFSINGRRLNDHVKTYNKQRPNIPVKKAYLEAYLYFLGVDQISRLVQDIAIPEEIHFNKSIPIVKNSVPRPQRRYLFILLLVFLVAALAIIRYSGRSSMFDKCQDYGHLSACISSPDNGDSLISETIKVSGHLHHLPAAQEAILVVERANTKGKKVYWYKEHTKISNGTWFTTILEQPDPMNRDYSSEFSIILLAVDSIQHRQSLQAWIEASRPDDDQEANFVPLNGILGAPLDRIENLVLK